MIPPEQHDSIASRLLRRRRITESGCWEYTGRRNRQGYGNMHVDGETLVHRIAFRLWIGSIPPGLCVCHRCDNPSCFCPQHLYTGTHADNTADMVKKGRASKGPSKGASKGPSFDHAAYMRGYMRGYMRARRLAESPEAHKRRLTHLRTRYHADPERARAYKRARYRAESPEVREHRRAYMKAWYAAHPNYYRDRRARRKNQAPGGEAPTAPTTPAAPTTPTGTP